MFCAQVYYHDERIDEFFEGLLAYVTRRIADLDWKWVRKVEITREDRV